MTPILLSDTELDHQAAVYAANPVFRRLGVTFEEFLTHGPLACLRDLSRYPDTLPLLPAQERVRIRLAGQWSQAKRARAGGPLQALEAGLESAGCQMQGGRWVEKLRHKAWPRKRVWRSD